MGGQGAAAPFGGQSAPDAFGSTSGPQFAMPGGLTTAGPPLGWFAIALALVVVGVALAVTGMLVGGVVGPITAIACWLLAGPVAIGALSMYSRIDTRRRSEAVYSAPTWTTTAYWVVLAVCFIGIAVGAWRIALWAGRL